MTQTRLLFCKLFWQHRVTGNSRVKTSFIQSSSYFLLHEKLNLKTASTYGSCTKHLHGKNIFFLHMQLVQIVE